MYLSFHGMLKRHDRCSLSLTYVYGNSPELTVSSPFDALAVRVCMYVFVTLIFFMKTYAEIAARHILGIYVHLEARDVAQREDMLDFSSYTQLMQLCSRRNSNIMGIKGHGMLENDKCVHKQPKSPCYCLLQNAAHNL